MTQKSCLLGEGCSVMDSSYSKMSLQGVLLAGGTQKQYLAGNRCPSVLFWIEAYRRTYLHSTVWISHNLTVCPGMWLSLPLFPFLEVFAGTTQRERLTWALGAAIYPPPLPHCVALGKSCNYTGTLFPSPETRTINISPLTLGFLWGLKPATDSAFLLRAFLSKKPH